MSRIPPPRGGGLPRPVSKTPDVNQAGIFKKPTVSALTRTVGIKRPGDSQMALSEKRAKVEGVSAARRNKGAEENENAVKRTAGFSERAKRAALKPIAESVMVRGSLPAISVTKPKTGSGKAKRPAWDLKGRIQDMEEHFHEAQTSNVALNERIAALEAANQLLHKDVEIKSTQSEEATTQISKLEKLLREKTEELYDKIQERDRTISMLTEEKRQIQTDFTALKSEHELLRNTYQQETTALKSSITSLTCSKSGLQTQLDATEHLLENLKEELKKERQAKIESKEECKSWKTKTKELEKKLLEGESYRKKLHNTIQELKGNIRVFCRIRPALPEEVKNNIKLAHIATPNAKTVEISEPVVNETSGKTQKKLEYNFDAVFTPTASQQEVFEEISQLVQSSIDGYNVCIFAYGQTGSGKTYTMEGPESVVEFLASQNESHLGMIPRAVQHIFKCIQELEPRGWSFKVESLFLEIYNERIQDLLNSDSLSGNAKCEIIKSATKGNDCLLSNVEASPVSCAEEVLSLLKKARINRVVASTKCNEYSSRSHYVFQLKVVGENSVTGEKSEGTLNLVDLAGSERVKESGSEGDRLTEAKAINKSLSNLGKVIMALSRKDNHIPYRDSKLTHLLANSLGGNSKTLMFVNISPDNNNLSETINSLRFASKVNQCNIGTAQKRVK